jgi:hypothetical protein
MPADGLTKVLPRQKFAEFVYLFSLIGITKRLKGLRQADRDDLNALYIH